MVAPAADLSGTMFVVPGAVGSTPGVLVLYLTRPVGVPRTRPLLLNALSASNLYETYDYEILWHTGTWVYATSRTSFTFDVYLLMRSGQHLSAVSENLAGALSVSTQGLNANALIGEPSQAFTHAYSRTLSTH